MPTQSVDPLAALAERFFEYLPTLMAGMLLVAVGVALGWLVKRAVQRILLWLRLDRLAGHSGWRTAFGKGDVRAAMYNLLGGVAMLLVVLLFLDNALQIWGLTVLSGMIDRLVFYVPNLGLVALIAIVGSMLANLAAGRVEAVLRSEGFVRARLIGLICQAVLLSIVTALALWQLDFARQIVLAAFLIEFGAIGAAFVLAVGLGSVRSIQAGWQALVDRRERE